MKTVLHTLAMLVAGIIYVFGFLWGLFYEIFCEGLDDGDAAVDSFISYICDEKE